MMIRIDRRAIAVSAVLAALLAGPMEADAQDIRQPGTIRVSATGEARTPPDRAWADFGVETEAATAGQAAEQNARKMEAVIAALVRAGVPRENVRTSDFNVFPVHENLRDGSTGEPRIRGYRAANLVTAQTDDVRRVGPLVDAALAAGANRIQGVRFGMRDPDRARDAALRDALRRARAEAAVLAEGMGVQLGRVLDVSTAATPPMPYPVAYRMAAQMADAGAATPIEPGQQTVNATVTVVFEIGGG